MDTQPKPPHSLSRILDSVEKSLEERYGKDWRNADQDPNSDLGIICLLYGLLASREVIPEETLAKDKLGMPPARTSGYLLDHPDSRPPTKTE